MPGEWRNDLPCDSHEPPPDREPRDPPGERFGGSLVGISWEPLLLASCLRDWVPRASTEA